MNINCNIRTLAEVLLPLLFQYSEVVLQWQGCMCVRNGDSACVKVRKSENRFLLVQSSQWDYWQTIENAFHGKIRDIHWSLWLWYCPLIYWMLPKSWFVETRHMGWKWQNTEQTIQDSFFFIPMRWGYGEGRQQRSLRTETTYHPRLPITKF